MNISRAFRTLSFKRLEKCNHNPGYYDSCVPCKNCGKKRMSYEEEDNRCCYMPAPNFGTTTTTGNVVDTPTLKFDDIECATLFECKFETNGHWHDSDQVVKVWTTSISTTTLTRNVWFSFTMAPGDEIYFEFINNLAENKCITIHMKNHDCNLNYGTVGQLCLES
jgi:hypothetical protein